MITVKRLVLTTSTPRILNMLKRFEGIEEIAKSSDVPVIWNYNKTPLVDSTTTIIKGYDEYSFEVPDFEDSKFINNFTKWSHEHGFECGEFRTGHIYDTREEPCVLCAIAKHKGINPSTAVYNAYVDNEVDCIIYESPNFLVTCELGALKTGFLMIIPKEHHYLSVAQLPVTLFPEYQEVCRDTEIILQGAFGNYPVSFFEHGSGPSGKTSHKKSIVHAHTHVVIGFQLAQKYLDMIQMKSIDDITKARNTHYFAYKLGANGNLLCCYDDHVYVQRQFPRQVMAMQLGYSPGQYNWRKHTFSENVHSTLYHIYKFLSSKKLRNTRIQDRTEAFTIGYRLRNESEH